LPLDNRADTLYNNHISKKGIHKELLNAQATIFENAATPMPMDRRSENICRQALPSGQRPAAGLASVLVYTENSKMVKGEKFNARQK